MRIQSFRDLDAWRVAMDVTVVLYDVIGRLPPTERFELASQMRRAAVSVPSNIAEGQAYGPGLRYRNHVRIAKGSVAELSTCVEVCVRLRYITGAAGADVEDRLDRMRQLLYGLERSILTKLASQTGVVLVLLFLSSWV